MKEMTQVGSWQPACRTGRLAVGKTMSIKMAVVLLLSVVSGLSSVVYSQSISASLKADSTKILIGDPLHVKFTLKHGKEYEVLRIMVDTALSMEPISMEKLDTSVEGGNTVLTQNMIVSAYDSGQFYVGPFKAFFKKNGGPVDSISSNEILVGVTTIAVDTTKPFKPIKAPLDVPYTWQEFVVYIIAGAVLLIVAIVAFVLWRRYKKAKPAVVARPKPKDPAHVWARKELKKLEEEKLATENPKMYYSRLTDILRLYLEYRYNWMALESTTEEIIKEIGGYGINDVAKNLLLDTLRSSDLVKFAKLTPMPDANARAMENAKQFVEMTIPVETKTEVKK